MQAQQIQCPSCFARVQAPLNSTQTTCTYCQQPLQVPDEVQAATVQQLNAQLLSQRVNAVEQEAEVRGFDETWKSRLQVKMVYDASKGDWKKPHALGSWLGIVICGLMALIVVGAFASEPHWNNGVFVSLVFVLPVFFFIRKIIRVHQYQKLHAQYLTERQQFIASLYK